MREEPTEAAKLPQWADGVEVCHADSAGLLVGHLVAVLVLGVGVPMRLPFWEMDADSELG